MFEVVLVILAILLNAVGLVGCVLPVLPGPPLSFLGLLLLWWGRGFETEAFGAWTVLILGISAVLVTIVDTLAPVIGARKYGASKAGVWGSIIGMVVGILGFLPLGPLGMLLGAFLGAVAGEIASGKGTPAAIRAAWGVFMGTVVGLVLKLVVSLAAAFYLIVELF